MQDKIGPSSRSEWVLEVGNLSTQVRFGHAETLQGAAGVRRRWRGGGSSPLGGGNVGEGGARGEGDFPAGGVENTKNALGQGAL